MAVVVNVNPFKEEGCSNLPYGPVSLFWPANPVLKTNFL